MIEKQSIQSTKGGKREGAGRPKGSSTKPKIADFLTEVEIKGVVDKAKEKIEEGDVTMIKFILEQIMGKAAQSMDVTSDGEALQIMFDNVFSKDATTRTTKEDS